VAEAVVARSSDTSEFNAPVEVVSGANDPQSPVVAAPVNGTAASENTISEGARSTEAQPHRDDPAHDR